MVRVIWIWLVLATTAYAQPRTDAGLVWHAPPSCPGEAEVRGQIERRLGRPLDSAVHGIEVEITASPRRPVTTGSRISGSAWFVARIDVRGVTLSSEARVLTSDRCDELTSAVAVVVARLAAEHGPRPAEPAHPVDRADPVAPAFANPGPVRIAASVTPPVPRVWGGGGRVLGISGIGVMPDVGVGGELAGYVRRNATFVELTATRWLRVHEVRLDVLALRVGWRPEHLPLRAWLAAERGAVTGPRSDVAGAGYDASGQWTGLGTGFGVAWPMSSYARLVGVIEAVVPLQRDRFLVMRDAEMHRPDLVVVRSGLGLEVGWQ